MKQLILPVSDYFGCLFRFVHLWTLTVSTILYSSGFAEILIKPMNTVSLVGNQTRIECSRNPLDLPVEWRFSPARSSNFSYIFTGGRIRTDRYPRHKIETDGKKRYDIVIDSVDFSDAGTYRCTVGSTSASAELIVLAVPNCGADEKASKGETVEGDYIKLRCSVTFNGNWSPRYKQNISNWRSPLATSSIARSDTYYIVSPAIRLPMAASDNGVTLTWKTYFEPQSLISSEDKANEAIATNVPPYQNLWNFKANVLYGVRNLTIEPTSEIYVVGDRLVCSADGNPSPTFQWTEPGSKLVTLGPILIIDGAMALLGNLTLTCTANNTLSVESKEISFTVKEGSSNAAVSTMLSAEVLFVKIALAFAVALSVKG